jgi:hypothetical protein
MTIPAIPLAAGPLPAANIVDASNAIINAVNGSFGQAGLLFSYYTATGNGADTTEDTLATFSLPANTFATTGEMLRIRAWGKTAANGDNKTMKLYFGASVVTTPTAATNNKGWFLQLEVIRSGASTQQVFGTGLVDTTAVTPYYNAGADTDTAAIVIKCTGQAGTGNANDILLEGMVIETVV